MPQELFRKTEDAPTKGHFESSLKIGESEDQLALVQPYDLPENMSSDEARQQLLRELGDEGAIVPVFRRKNDGPAIFCINPQKVKQIDSFVNMYVYTDFDTLRGPTLGRKPIDLDAEFHYVETFGAKTPIYPYAQIKGVLNDGQTFTAKISYVPGR
ncbi:hypothetical protein HY357_04450 [Candidatus Roizmanbacteria bacterium]|nr:hypothetical protein [Candidatus Roizmanbacteria bacterium]